MHGSGQHEDVSFSFVGDAIQEAVKLLRAKQQPTQPPEVRLAATVAISRLEAMSNQFMGEFCGLTWRFR